MAMMWRLGRLLFGGDGSHCTLLLLVGQIADEIRFQLFLVIRPVVLMRGEHFIVDVIRIGTSSCTVIIHHPVVAVDGITGGGRIRTRAIDDRRRIIMDAFL